MYIEPNSRSHAVRGFTLIELSVVLVIIGLLIGGMIVGRSLLRQSEISSMMVDEQKYISAVQSFQQKYASLPGDMANATTYWGSAGGSSGTNYTTDCYASGTSTSPATCNGNGDGQITYGGTYANESLRVWQHLADAGFITGAYTGITGAAHTVGTNCPAAKPAGTGFGIAWLGISISNAYNFDANYGHAMFMGGNTTGLPDGATLTGMEAQSIDNKFDDGKPAFGKILTWKNGTLTCASTAVSSTAIYSTSSLNVCSLIVITGF